MDLPIVDVLVPTTGSAAGLGATLAALATQRYPSFRVTAARPPPGESEADELSGPTRVLEAHGHATRIIDAATPPIDGGLPQLLLDRAAAQYVLVVDDGVLLEADLIGRLVAGIRTSGGAFLGSNVVDLRFRDEHRPEEEVIAFWDGPVRPEDVRVGSPAWARRKVHRGANLQHLRERLPRTRDRLYHVADIQGCVLYDTSKLRSVGGFQAARERSSPGRAIPPVTASATQLRLLERYGGAGLFPSGAYRLTPAVTERSTRSAVGATAPEIARPGAPEDDRDAAGPRSWALRANGPVPLLRRLRESPVNGSRHAGAPGVRRSRRGGTMG